jgi:hypothetical protein
LSSYKKIYLDLNFSEWMKNIKKWCDVPKIKIDLYNENENENQTESIEFFQAIKSEKKDLILKRGFSFKHNIFSSKEVSSVAQICDKNIDRVRPITKSNSLGFNL